MLGSGTHPISARMRAQGVIRVASDLSGNVREIVFSGADETMADVIRTVSAALPEIPTRHEDRSGSTASNIRNVSEFGITGPVILVSDHHHVRGAAYCMTTVYDDGPVSFVQVPEVGRGYSENRGYTDAIPAQEMNALRITSAPTACEGGYYFRWCCDDND